MNTHEIDEVALMDEYLIRLKQIHKQLLVRVEKVETIIRTLQSERPALSKDEKPLFSYSNSDMEKLKDGSWGEIVRWSLTQYKESVPLTILTKQVAQLPLKRIQQRVMDNTLYQVLRVHAEALVRGQEVVKIKNSKRKGGVMYQLK